MTQRNKESAPCDTEPKTSDNVEPENEEAERQRIERLGRERPAKLKSFTAEIFFCYSVIASQFIAVRRWHGGESTSLGLCHNAD